MKMIYQIKYYIISIYAYNFFCFYYYYYIFLFTVLYIKIHEL